MRVDVTKNSLRKYANGMKGLTPRDQRLMVRLTTQPFQLCLLKGFMMFAFFKVGRMQIFVRNYLLPILKPFNWSNPCSVVKMDYASI